MTLKDGKIVKGSYQLKVIETSNAIEVWRYEKPVYNNYHSSNLIRKNFDEMSFDEKIESLKRRQKYYKNKRWEIKRLVDSNFDNRTSFLTLTFKDSVKDVTIANKEFKYFIDRFKRYLKKNFNSCLKYLATNELQNGGRRSDNKGRNVWHFHLILFSLPYVPVSDIEKIWGKGFVKINKIDKIEKENKGLYISKYFTKNLDSRGRKQKSYFKSRNLKQPVIDFYFPNNSNSKLKVIKDNFELSYEKNYSIKNVVMGQWYDNSVHYYVFKKK